MKKFLKEILPYLIIIVVVIIIRTFIITPVSVDGPSMNNTLFDKDIMLLNKFDKNYQRNDIVVFKRKMGGVNERLIKRVIALPGEKIKCVSGIIYVNNEEYEDKYATGNTSDFPETIVGENEYFVMGDNRNNSLDSRSFGPVKKEKILGKTDIVIYPFNHFKIGN